METLTCHELQGSQSSQATPDPHGIPDLPPLLMLHCQIRSSDSDVESSQIPQNSKSTSGSNEGSLLIPKTWTAACIPSSFSPHWLHPVLEGTLWVSMWTLKPPSSVSPPQYPIFGHGSLGVGTGTSACHLLFGSMGPGSAWAKEFWDPSTQRWSLYEQVFLAQRPYPHIRRFN